MIGDMAFCLEGLQRCCVYESMLELLKFKELWSWHAVPGVLAAVFAKVVACVLEPITKGFWAAVQALSMVVFRRL